MNSLIVSNREELASAIEFAPLDKGVEIYLVRGDGHTRYVLPAVIDPDGGEVCRHGYWNGLGDTRTWTPQFINNEQHVAYQRKRRDQLAKQVRRMAARLFT